MENNIVKIQIDNIISIYDTDEDENVHKHISSLTAVIGEDLATGLLKHYFESILGVKRVIVLDEKPREQLNNGENKNKGKRLDSWVMVESNRKIFYQTEIKNWSAHSIAGYRGKKLKLCCDEEELKKFANYKFHDQWDVKSKTFNSWLPYVSKVLKEMEKPKNEIYNSKDEVEPLICYWYPISPIDEFKSFNRIESKDSIFSHVNFFSMSLYLRELSKNNIREVNVEVPNVTRRLEYFKNIFK